MNQPDPGNKPSRQTRQTAIRKKLDRVSRAITLLTAVAIAGCGETSRQADPPESTVGTIVIPVAVATATISGVQLNLDYKLGANGQLVDFKLIAIDPTNDSSLTQKCTGDFSASYSCEDGETRVLEVNRNNRGQPVTVGWFGGPSYNDSDIRRFEWSRSEEPNAELVRTLAQYTTSFGNPCGLSEATIDREANRASRLHIYQVDGTCSNSNASVPLSYTVAIIRNPNGTPDQAIVQSRLGPVTLPYQTVAFSYANNRLTSIKITPDAETSPMDAGPQTMSFEYDARGNLSQYRSIQAVGPAQTIKVIDLAKWEIQYADFSNEIVTEHADTGRISAIRYRDDARPKSPCLSPRAPDPKDDDVLLALLTGTRVLQYQLNPSGCLSGLPASFNVKNY
jgi:hypothetical protein